MGDGQPVLEIDTKRGVATRRGLTLGQISDAAKMIAAGEATTEEMEAMYPGLQSATAEMQQGITALSEAARAALEGPALAAASISQRILASQVGLSETIKRATESVARIDTSLLSYRADPLLDLGDLAFRDPDEATRHVASEVRELAAKASAMAENTRTAAELGKASLDHTAALVAVVQELHQTTRASSESSERSELAIVRLTVVLVILTAAIFGLTAVLVIRPG